MTTVHVAPNVASAASIRAALDAAGDGNAEVVACRDDLSCGPIDQGDRRTWWTSTFTGEMGRDQLHLWDRAGGIDPAQLDADPDARLIVWVGRRSAQESACYLLLAEHFRMRPWHVADVTIPAPHGDDSAIGTVAALPSARVGDYLGSERRLGDAERAELARQWSTLRSENAPLRVVAAESTLVSAPIDHFDTALLARITSEHKPMTKVIAQTMADHPFQAGDYILQQRLISLIDSGAVSAEGDPTTARTCLIRRTSR